MTKEVIVSLKGVQTGEGQDGEPIELISHGTYEYKDEKHVVEYEEIDEENQEVTKVSLRFNEEYVEIVKCGMANVTMAFQSGQKTTSCYGTPYGDLNMGIDTGRIVTEITEELIRIEMEYVLDMNYQHLADCSMHISIRSKGVKE